MMSFVISTGADLPAIIDLVFKPSIACGIGAWLAFEHNGASVRQNEPRPDQENTGRPGYRNSERPVGVPKMDSVTCAMICPDKSERRPVMSAAGITDPACTMYGEADLVTRSGLVVRRSMRHWRRRACPF